MKKMLLTAVALMALLLSLYGQSPTINMSHELELANAKELKGLLHADGSGYYMYFQEERGFGNRRNFYLEKYDKSFQPVFSQKYKTNRRGRLGQEMKYFKNKFAFLQYRQNVGQRSLEYFLTSIDLDGKASQPKSIAKLRYGFRPLPDVNWKISSDTTKMLFVASVDENLRRRKLRTNISVIDEKFNTVWQKEIKFPYSQRRMDIQSWEVANNGKVYFVAKIYDSNRSRESKVRRNGLERNRVPAYDMVIFVMDRYMDKPEEIDLKLEDVFAKGVQLNVDEFGALTCVGLFSDRRWGTSQGIFYLKMSTEDEQITFADQRRFSPRELDSFGNRNINRGRHLGLDRTFTFGEIITLENGETYATIEERYVDESTSVDADGNVCTSETYVSNSIIVVNISASGMVQNIGIIPKRQRSGQDTYQSYTTLRSKDRIYFVYNDDRDNLRKNITDPDRIRRISSRRDKVAVMADMDKQGRLNRIPLFSRADTQTMLMPLQSVQISENELFFFNSRPKIGKDKFRFGVVVLGDD